MWVSSCHQCSSFMHHAVLVVKHFPFEGEKEMLSFKPPKSTTKITLPAIKIAKGSSNHHKGATGELGKRYSWLLWKLPKWLSLTTLPQAACYLSSPTAHQEKTMCKASLFHFKAKLFILPLSTFLKHFGRPKWQIDK